MTLSTGCTLFRKPLPEIVTVNRYSIPKIDPRLKTCADWPAKPSTVLQSYIAEWAVEARIAYLSCKNNNDGIIRTLTEAEAVLKATDDQSSEP